MSLRREDLLRQAGAAGEWEVAVVGGGATGLGTALEAVSRGYRTILLEAFDFAKGTSSRSTKLVHGGVRYLEQGNLKLVFEALRERGRILRNAPHLAHRRAFVVPAYSAWELPYYGAGLTLYDLLAGRDALGRSRVLSRSRVCEELPGIRQSGLKGGILYYDGQFDDARLAIAILRTLLDQGGVALNYAPVTGLLKRNGLVSGVAVEDSETGARFEIGARVVINATGVFSDTLRREDEPQAAEIVRVSQGTHLVLPRSFLPGESALMVPRTSDGRVLFAIPWHDRVVVGTTDDPAPQPVLEPRAMPQEQRFLLDHIERFFGRRPEASEICSQWSGQRPLVQRSNARSTAELSRDHMILISNSKLVTITGGKWTTYRKMAEDTIDRAAVVGKLAAVKSRTADLPLHGSPGNRDASFNPEWQQVYGTDLPMLHQLALENAGADELLHDHLPFRRVEVLWAVRHEMARTVEDVLARRTRALFLDARASIEAAPLAARLMAQELGKNADWEEKQVLDFRRLAEQYLYA